MRIKPGTAKLIIEAFARKTLDEQAKTYSGPIERIKTDAIDLFIHSSQPLLPKMPN